MTGPAAPSAAASVAAEPAGNACAITNLIFDKKDELAKVHKAANALDRELAVETGPVELHPGAAQALNK